MKYLFFLVMMLFSTMAVYNIGHTALPTEAQLEKYFIQVRLTVDEDLHNFYVGAIESFDETELVVRYFVGKYPNKIEKRNHIPRADILNYEEAKTKFDFIKGGSL